MPYPGQFHRLVVIGTIYTDQFNFTLSIVPSALGELGMPAVDDATLAAVASDVGTWFPKLGGDPGPGFLTPVKLVSIKLNRIGPDGRYVDAVAKEHIYPSPISGAVSGNAPAQLTIATTLKTAIERGRGSKGRVYLPPTLNATAVTTDGRITTTQASAQNTAVKLLIDELNSTYTLIGRVGVASNAGAGRFEHVTRVATGRVVDTMRSRRSSLVEDYQELAL